MQHKQKQCDIIVRKLTLVVVICDTFIAVLAVIYVTVSSRLYTFTFAAELIVQKSYISF